ALPIWGVIDGQPVPVGPAWCAPTAAGLERALANVRFGMEVNGRPVELTAYPLVRLRLREGDSCAWLGVASRLQRASQHRFVYTIEPATLGGVGVLVAVAGAALDEWWHVNVGKDVNLWSPPHLVGLAGAVLIVLGLAFALAAHTRYGLEPRRWVPRVILLCAFADLVHKAMVALDHYTLDAWGRTPDFYPFLLALFLPAILVTAVRALGPGAATATTAVFAVEHSVILLVLLAVGMRIPTFTPIPILPAVAIEIGRAHV